MKMFNAFLVQLPSPVNSLTRIYIIAGRNLYTINCCCSGAYDTNNLKWTPNWLYGFE